MSDVTQNVRKKAVGHPEEEKELLPMTLRNLAAVKMAQEKPGQSLPDVSRALPARSRPGTFDQLAQ
ncbi:MAG: hypothetical protein DWQ34_23845 [Planctomycetota bacterium]|nr:MAG: hypothetical protein DWQ34_23845 [Planctomycetota bacterium]REK29636.1 MAG: hypothetical protein DWQ41_03080 [Planctomycetota bacterium]REK30543.1 MAG: hypothetical protein DWQ45_21955 [Planctomycetota bacterium]